MSKLLQKQDFKVKGLLRTTDVSFDDLAHGYRVAQKAYKLALRRGLGESYANKLFTAAVFHDIGKCKVPGEIINKPGTLTEGERSCIQRHVEAGCQLCKLAGVQEPLLTYIAGHHENYDGTGYPKKLRGEEISLGARILKICDVYDALSTSRIYRPAYSRKKTIEIMRAEETTFDPQLLEMFWEEVVTNED